MKVLLGCVLFFLLSLVPHADANAQVAALPSRLDLYGGQVMVYKSSRPLARVAVGNGDLIEVTTIEKRQLVVIAGTTAAGTTDLHLWYEDGTQRSVDVNVTPVNGNETVSTLRKMLGFDSKATVSVIDDKVVVTGEVTAEEQLQLETLSKVYPTIVNLSTPDLVSMQPTVLMDVRIMEFKRDALRDLGISWDNVIDGPSGGAIKDFNRSSFRILPDGSPFLDIIDDLPAYINPMQTYFGIATSITSRINLMTQNGDAYELASPQLSARSGGEASFLAGGEVPIPIAGAFGSTNVQFKDYGIKLEIRPVVNDKNEIATFVATEVSKIDPSVSVAGIPGFLTRKTDTEMNLKDGQTMVISGLVDITGSKGISGIPGLANIPVLGRLFRSDQFRAGRTDLVVFVTPRIVNADHPANIDGIQKSDRLLEEFKQRIGTDIFD